MISLLAPTAADCCMSVVQHHGIRGVRIVRAEVDRIYCSDTEGLLEEYVTAKGKSKEWNDRELDSTFKAHHPFAVKCWREKDCPGLQVLQCVPDKDPELYANGKMWEIDIDEFPPKHLSWTLFAHWYEVGRNWLKRKKTDYAVTIPRMLLERRGIVVERYECLS